MRKLLLLCIMVTAAAARADVPAPEGYVELCTLEKQCPTGKTCPYYHGETNAACAKTMAEAGLTERCKTRGASSATVVFCPPGAQPAPEPTKSGWCAVGGDGGHGAGLGALIVGALLLAWWRSRVSRAA